MTEALDTVLAYHQRTKHRFQGYAAGPDGLDWANQPAAFRWFSGSPQVLLPLQTGVEQPRYVDLYTPGKVSTQPLTIASIAALLELSLGLSAWKQHGESRWALRCNPSSGNLHPTEAYVVIAGRDDAENGVYHYLSRDHLLEQRCIFAAGNPDTLLPADTLLLGLSSVHWREAWKYGERAFRYCQHDTGHAVAAVRYAAALLGWQVKWLEHWGDDQTATLLGLDRAQDFGLAEAENADLMLQITAAPVAASLVFPDSLITAARNGHWQGKANVLSGNHGHRWPIIDTVADACHKPSTAADPPWPSPVLPAPLPSACTLAADTLIRQRRSAQAFDARTGITRDAFFRMLDMTLPRANLVPWDVTGSPPSVHLLLFVHRVDGLVPGLYLLLRNPAAEAKLKTAIGRDFSWQTVPGTPKHLPLFQLLAADAREAAKALSCNQDIAADGAFSLGMLAEYKDALSRAPWRYRQLFWETGMIGQVLYLEAEAAGVRGTGIGCFFDDGVHDMLAIQDHDLQSLYHFTIGGPRTDNRLQTLPPYAHLRGR
ncbi:MAG: SagB/ThcOx family dehydrogenase [Sedimenticolaceae bacterium]